MSVKTTEEAAKSPRRPQSLNLVDNNRSPFSSPRLVRDSRRKTMMSGVHSRTPNSKKMVRSTSSDSSEGKGAATTPVSGLHLQLHRPPAFNNYNTTHSWASLVVEHNNHLGHHQEGDGISVRSLASIGMGSTDGKRLTIRRVPTSPTELLNIAQTQPPTTPGEMSTGSSCCEDSEDEEDSGGRRKRKRMNKRAVMREGAPVSRAEWANKLQFILACIAYSVGLGNLWRFPYLCYKSGGGVFLVPYYLILITCGIPMLYMELAMGQSTNRGPIGALSKLCPLFKGAGLSSVVVSFFMSTYYSVIIAYALFYFFTAFRSDSPWSECTNRWNTEDCWHPHPAPNSSIPSQKPNLSQTPAEEFYERKVLQLSSGIEEMGSVRWELAACLLFAWILVYFSLWKSVRSSGRVLYLTCSLPFVIVLAFLGRSLTLDGAHLGIDYLFKPRWHLLAESKVWVNAAAQNFNSIGIAFGSVISFASYNRHGNQILVDTLTVSAINAVTSLMVGVFAFATIGNIATEHQTSIENVLADGPGLVFVVYPQAMSKMPFSNFWAVLFFFMLLCLGLNSQFAIVEVVVTSVQDGFPNWIKKKLLCHEILVLVVCIVSFLFGLPHITQGGIYFFQLVDHFAVSNSIMYIAFFEVVAVAWFYGADRLSADIQKMTQIKPFFYFKFCWKFAAPSLILCLLVYSLIDYESPTYNNGAYSYPTWAVLLGWSITASCLIWVPLMAIYVVARSQGKTFFQKLHNSVRARNGEGDEDGDLYREEQRLVEVGAGKTPNIIGRELTRNLLDYKLPIQLDFNKIKSSSRSDFMDIIQ